MSFDLSHNVVYVLPTSEECKHAAKQRHREEWQRRSLNEDMLSEDIIAEIQEQCSRDSDEELLALPIKSCLKKPPTEANIATNMIDRRKKKKHSSRKKRSNHGNDIYITLFKKRH